MEISRFLQQNINQIISLVNKQTCGITISEFLDRCGEFNDTFAEQVIIQDMIGEYAMELEQKYYTIKVIIF